MLKIMQLLFLPSDDKWVDPVSQGIITSLCDERISPITGANEVHKGIDIGVPLDTKVVAVKSGEVTKVGTSPTYGNYVGYKTYDGYDVFYAHLNKAAVNVGDIVEQGQIIAYSGNTGSSTGPHLHYEIEYNNEMINPKEYVSLREQ